jgi:Xaa-Pro aminopeptidase
MLNPDTRSNLADNIPFDRARLDRLMDDENLDLLLATSKHNVQYLLGGHRADFFDYMDATGITRYLPVVIYPKGAPEKAIYIGHRLEKWQREANPMWTPETHTDANGSVDAMKKAIDAMKRLGLKPRRIGAELGFLPFDAAMVLRAAFPDAELIEATLVLDRQRAKKSPEELKKLKHASETVLAAMQAIIANHGPGTTKRELVEALKREEVNRGLTFEYCLITAGASHNRAPTEQRWEKGDVLSVDSGGNFHGYIGDICRMAIQGEPDAELDDLLGEIESIQQVGFKAIRAGATGRDIYAAAEPLVAKSRHHNHMDFLAHGMGLVSHEAPRLTERGVAVPYMPEHRDKPLEAGMVVSVETTLLHPTRGFIKLEDTVVVTESGHELYAGGGRGWNRGGTAAKH